MKLKTRKSVAKRFKITAKKKLLRRSSRQNHFNARDSGNKTRQKRRQKRISKADEKNIKRLLPYT
ncbi:MAG TPA: 50S ribosomal protein L35 [Candidatus Portnoybacteria bacterium]|nr:50S ribosomal protein L35 [Candidatus Portnoybacteria bacterium]